MVARKRSRLVKALQAVEDPRRPGGNLRHSLVDILVLSFCGILSGASDFAEVIEFVDARIDFFKQFLRLSHGVPSEDTFERVFARVKPMQLQAALIDWLKEVRQQSETTETDSKQPRVVAIDGKTMRRSFDTKSGLGALHVVSAWASEEGLILGQIAVDQKSNEITAIPKLLELLDLEDSVVTIDAAGCQKAIAGKIIDQKGDYLLALKGNHPKFYEQVIDFFLEQDDKPSSGLRRIVQKEKGHGRSERREVVVAAVPADFPGRQQWPGLKTLVMISRQSVETLTQKESGDVRYFLSSLPAKAKLSGHIGRTHWGIENGLHWSLDVTFKEDLSRLRKDHAPENLAMLNRIALSLVKGEASTKASLKCKRKRAGWNTDYLMTLLTSQA